MRFLSALLFAGLCAIGASAFAATVTVNVTPTFAPASGIVSGYRAYRACDTTPILIGPAASGQIFSFQHDTASPDPRVSVRAYNEAGEGTGNCVTLALTLAPPGDTTTTYVCELDPVAGGTCVAQ